MISFENETEIPQHSGACVLMTEDLNVQVWGGELFQKHSTHLESKVYSNLHSSHVCTTLLLCWHAIKHASRLLQHANYNEPKVA